MIEDVKLILEIENIFVVPKAPEYIWGVINHRGRIITVLDLSSLMGLKKPQRDKASRVIVLDSDLVDVGLFVSHVYDFHAVTADQLKEVPVPARSDIAEKDDRFINKMTQYNESVVSIVDKKRLEKYLFHVSL